MSCVNLFLRCFCSCGLLSAFSASAYCFPFRSMPGCDVGVQEVGSSCTGRSRDVWADPRFPWAISFATMIPISIFHVLWQDVRMAIATMLGIFASGAILRLRWAPGTRHNGIVEDVVHHSVIALLGFDTPFVQCFEKRDYKKELRQLVVAMDDFLMSELLQETQLIKFPYPLESFYLLSNWESTRSDIMIRSSCVCVKNINSPVKWNKTFIMLYQRLNSNRRISRCWTIDCDPIKSFWLICFIFK